MASRYGRSLAGRRIRCPAPLNKGARFSLIAAICVKQVQTALYGEWSTNLDIFKDFIDRELAPKLSSQSIVVMDNIAFHKNREVIQKIETIGAKVIFLPPYSPDLSPVENLWSKIKHYLPKGAPRTVAAFQKAIRRAFLLITPDDLQAWFKHCGYKT